MILYPAVDIQAGKAVRLKQGKKNLATIFSDNPLDMAKNWHDQGAEWLHIVDLDGAFEGTSANVKNPDWRRHSFNRHGGNLPGSGSRPNNNRHNGF